MAISPTTPTKPPAIKSSSIRSGSPARIYMPHGKSDNNRRCAHIRLFQNQGSVYQRHYHRFVARVIKQCRAQMFFQPLAKLAGAHHNYRQLCQLRRLQAERPYIQPALRALGCNANRINGISKNSTEK